MASGIYNAFKAQVLNGTFNLAGHTIKCALMGSGHSFNSDSHTVWSDISGNEVTGSGYTAGGATLGGVTVTQDNTLDAGVLDATDVQWTPSTITAYHAVLYDTSASNRLICSIDFGGGKASSAGLFEIQWASGGIISLA